MGLQTVCTPPSTRYVIAIITGDQRDLPVLVMDADYDTRSNSVRCQWRHYAHNANAVARRKTDSRGGTEYGLHEDHSDATMGSARGTEDQWCIGGYGRVRTRKVRT
jgi:hypothetical protein